VRGRVADPHPRIDVGDRGEEVGEVLAVGAIAVDVLSEECELAEVVRGELLDLA
jgi:hypothetical protein